MNTRNITILLIVLLVLVAMVYTLSGCRETSPVQRGGQRCVPQTCPSGGCPGEEKQIEIGKKKEPLWKV